MTEERIDAETENFKISIKKMNEDPEDGSLRAIVEASHKDKEEIPAYDQEIKYTGHSVNRFASDVIEINGEKDDDELKSELKSEILKHKQKTQELAEKRQERLQNEVTDLNETEPDNEVEEVITQIFRSDGPTTLEDLSEKHSNIRKIVDQNQELIIRNGQQLLLTEKGEENAQKILGFDKFEGDIDEEAEKQLKDDPLDYFLTAFNKTHKGDHLLKIWELVSALSSTLSNRKIHSWAVGASVSGDTPVFVKKEDGWHTESIRQLSKNYDKTKNWKTIGLNKQTLEAEETDINEVIAHRNKRKLVDIKTRSGREITGTLDHSFLRENQGEIEVAKGEELETGDYIPVLNNYNLGENDDIKSELGFILGMYLAEGHKQSKNKIHITNYDEVARQKTKEYCKKLDLELDVIRGEDISIDITSRKQLFDAAKTGSSQKVVPPRAFLQNKEFKTELLKGYFAGDGIDSKSIGYTTASRDLGLGISMLLQEKGITTTHRKRKAKDWSEDSKRYYYRHTITKPSSTHRFHDLIGFDRAESSTADKEKLTQQYIDRIPVDNEEIKGFLMSNKANEDTGRNKILRNENVKKNGEIGRSKLREGLEMYDYDKKNGYIKQLEKTLESNVFWDRIEELDIEDGKKRHRVYDIVAGENARHFLLGNGAVVHNSGSGKSHIKRQLVEHLLPEEMYRKMNSVSPKALLYETEKEGPDVLNNQLVFFDEVDDLEEVVTLLRSITDQDEDRIDHTMVRDQEAYTLSLNVDNITVWFTSVETINDEQLKNRFILTNPDGSEDLDEKVFNHQLENLHAGESPDSEPKESPVVRKMVQNIRKDTDGLTPIIPFKVNWKQKFNRRLYPYFVTLMGTLAKIHYKNRVIKDEKIYVTEADFKLASLIWDRIIDTTVAQTDDESLRLLEKLPENRGEALRSAELQMQLNGFSTNKVRDKIDSLQETEELNLVNSDMESGQYIYWAGEDRKKLVDNVPELHLNRDIAEDMLKKAGVEPEEEIIDNITGIEIPIYEDLVSRFKNYKDRMEAKREESKLDVELTGPEKLFLEQGDEYSWDVNLTHLEQMSDDLENTPQIATNLEEKEIITVKEDSGNLYAEPTAKYDQAKQEDLL